MADLRTQYLGLELANPLVPSSSPLTGSLDPARKLEDAGAAAIVLPSLFEEDLLAEEARIDRFLEFQGIGHGEADSYRPLPASYRSREDSYLELISYLKDALDIPVIASLNGVSDSGWLSHARDLQQAGADALELNVYYLASDPDDTATSVEQRYMDVATALCREVQIPVAMKLSEQLTAPIDLVRRLDATGIRGVSLFNRFYQPDIDLETLDVTPRLHLSSATESLLRIRWTAMLSGQCDCNIAVTGGFHSAGDALKALLAGADVVHLCSLLLREGPTAINGLLEDMARWMDEREYESVEQLKGSLSHRHAPDPGQYARANYLQVLDNYSSPGGVRT